MAGGRQDHLVLFPLNPFSPILSDLAYWKAKIQLKDGPTLLPLLIAMTDGMESSDPRDKIYALLGLCPRCDTSMIIPDYSKSVAEVFARVAAHSISEWANLVPLQAYYGSKRAAHNLPSWVPDYSDQYSHPQRYHSLVFPQHLNFSAGIKKCDGEQTTMAYALSSNANEIVLSGVYLDTVGFSSQSPVHTKYEGLDSTMRLQNSKDRTHKIQQAVKLWEMQAVKTADASQLFVSRKGPFPGSTNYQKQSKIETISEAFWRTLMAGRMSYHEGHEIPPSAIYQEYFEVWMGRAPVPEEFKLLNTNLCPDAIKELFTKPLTDAIIPKCHGRSFILTRRGTMGLAPARTIVGDVVAVLEGGNVPFILRHLEERKVENVPEYYSLVGESYIHGIMDGEVMCAAKDEEHRLFILR
ncbi:hypothetical protein IFR05_014309 [Cadophora sp. M221]|nr:hypothetical protein IFR05_014309 [Cadophora sp. M221]